MVINDVIMEKWEYLEKSWEYYSCGEFEIWLNKLGQEGWELASADLYGSSPIKCIFKRKIQ